MKRVYKMEDLDCPSCAAEMERALAKLDGVEAVNVNFIGCRLTLEADEQRFDEIMKRVVKTCRKIEPDCRILL